MLQDMMAQDQRSDLQNLLKAKNTFTWFCMPYKYTFLQNKCKNERFMGLFLIILGGFWAAFSPNLSNLRFAAKGVKNENLP